MSFIFCKIPAGESGGPNKPGTRRTHSHQQKNDDAGEAEEGVVQSRIGNVPRDLHDGVDESGGGELETKKALHLRDGDDDGRRRGEPDGHGDGDEVDQHACKERRIVRNGMVG